MIYKNYIIGLLEAQRYFTQTGLERLKKYAGDPEIYISYRNINKIGINPNNEYNTPYAIYAYPLNSFLGAMKHSGDVPFAGDHPYIYVFRVKPEYRSRFIDDVYQYSSADFDRDFEKLKRFAKSLTKQPYGSANYGGQDYDDIFDLDTYIGYKGFPRVKNPFGTLWFYIRELSDQAHRYSEEYKNSEPTMVWNVILRKVLGYCGVCDRGQGIIHPSEPTQAIFLSKDCIEEIEVIRNITDELTRTNDLQPKAKDPHRKVKFRNDEIVVVQLDNQAIVKKLRTGEVVAKIRGEFNSDLMMKFPGRTLMVVEKINTRGFVVIDDQGNVVRDLETPDIRHITTRDYGNFVALQIQYATNGLFDVYKVTENKFDLVLKDLIDIETNTQLRLKNYLIVDVGTNKKDSYSGVYDLSSDKYVIEPRPEYSYIEATEFLNHETRWVVHLKNSQGTKRIVTKG